MLLRKLEALSDPRSRALHPLPDVIFTALFALVCDCDACTEMALFAEEQLDWLRRYVPLPNGAPSHDTFRYVFGLIQPAALLEITAAWAGQIEGSHVIIDGKVSRGAKDTATGRSALHLLRAWVSSIGLSAGQRACADKSNELSTLPELLASLQLKGTVVSIDAMAGHPEIAQQIHTADGDWLLALKATAVSAAFPSMPGRSGTPSGGTGASRTAAITSSTSLGAKTTARCGSAPQRTI